MGAEVKELATDVLVIGSECAGACIPLAADAGDREITIVTKGLQGGSGATQLGGYSVNAAVGHPDGRDTPERHFEDTVIAGRYMGNQDLIWQYARDAPEVVRLLFENGIKWDLKDGNFDCTKTPGCRFPRSLHINYRTGFHLAKMLKKAVGRRANTRVLNYHFVTNLMTAKDGSGVTGAFVVDMQTGGLVVIRAKATVIAAGGASFIHPLHTGTHEATGDGYALAYRAGAELSDMEFVQFFPAMAYPPGVVGNVGPCTPPRYWMGAVMYNSLGERFMVHYDPVALERATRDVICRAIYTEIREGRGSPHGGVWLDATHMAPNFLEEQVKKYCGGKWNWEGVDLLAYGLDPRKVAMEIAPAAHYYMGGMVIDTEARTRVPGLFAAGEAVAGISGANRIAGNALSLAMVTGVWAGRSALRHGEKGEAPEANAAFVGEEAERVRKLMAGGEGDRGVHPVELRKRIQETFGENVNVVHSGEQLKKAQEVLREVRETPIGFTPTGPTFDRVLHEALTLDNLLVVGEMITGASLLREETRGSHAREDFPETDNVNWLKNILIHKEGDEMRFTPRDAVLSRLRPESAATQA